MPRQKRIYKERKLYYFECVVCGRPNSQTFRKRNRTRGLCRVCKRNKVHENQIPIFIDPKVGALY